MRLTLAGVGGAFGAREDLSMQVHACLLALHTGKPVKMVYGREESFFGHVHRHPARLRYEHGADRDGRLVYVKARIVLDGGAYASSVPGRGGQRGHARRRARTTCRTWRSTPTAPTPTTRRAGRCAASARCRPASRTSRRWTSWPPAVGLDPVEVRRRNALTTGAVMPTGQVVEGPAPVAELLGAGARRAAAARRRSGDPRELPGGVANTTHGEGVVRGVGYAIGIKNVCFSEGFDDYSTARVRLEVIGGEPAVLVHTAAAEVGPGAGHRAGADRPHRAGRRRR